MASLQINSQRAQIEAYQRQQASMLADFIASRIKVNRRARECYAFTDPSTGAPSVGVDANPSECIAFGTTATRQIADSDIAQWDLLIEGAGVELAGADVGAMQGARACIWMSPTADAATITVAWQGEFDAGSPPNPCGAGLYGEEGQRRVFERRIEFADMT